MKCPKCSYLGFETGNRCKNCGYDFSLLAATAAETDFDQRAPLTDIDFPLHSTQDEEPSIDVLDDIGRGARAPEPTAPLALTFASEGPVSDVLADVDFATPAPAQVRETTAPEPPLPLFKSTERAGDKPLIKLPSAPRPPMAVRRTPDTPRLRPAAQLASRRTAPPSLEFSEEGANPRDRTPPESPIEEPVSIAAPVGDFTSLSARLLAVVIDHAILIGIDVAVVYLTVRIAGLSMNEWRMLPLLPLLTFLALLKISYFYAFTALGGQTIGKMAMGTCVIADSGDAVDAALAMKRTCAGALSVLMLGLGFIPALFGNRRALHDRLAGTRVVRLRSV